MYMLTFSQLTMCNVKEVTHSNKCTKDYHQNL